MNSKVGRHVNPEENHSDMVTFIMTLGFFGLGIWLLAMFLNDPQSSAFFSTMLK